MGASVSSRDGNEDDADTSCEQVQVRPCKGLKVPRHTLRVFTHAGSRRNHVQTHTMPKVIWTYWQTLPVSKVVQLCMDSWRTFHPDMTIEVVTRDRLPDLLDLPRDPSQTYKWLDGVQRESDLVRCLLLTKYGGVWLDASFLLKEPLTFFNNQDKQWTHNHHHHHHHPAGGLGTAITTPPDFMGFHLKSWNEVKCSPVIENWALAAVPGSPFMRAWTTELLQTPNVSNGVQLKLDAFQREGIKLQGIRAMPHYLLMHVCAQAVLQRRPPAEGFHAILFAAEEGPFKYLVAAGWDSNKAAAEVLRVLQAPKPNDGTEDLRGVFKIRGCERAVLEKLLPS